jgi:hypothetical protein
MKIKIQPTRTYGDTTKAVLRGTFTDTSHILKGQKNLKWPNTTSQTPRKTRASKTQNPEREIIKIRAEINKIETKKPHKDSMKQKAGSLKKI